MADWQAVALGVQHSTATAFFVPCLHVDRQANGVGCFVEVGRGVVGGECVHRAHGDSVAFVCSDQAVAVDHAAILFKSDATEREAGAQVGTQANGCFAVVLVGVNHFGVVDQLGVELRRHQHANAAHGVALEVVFNLVCHGCTLGQHVSGGSSQQEVHGHLRQAKGREQVSQAGGAIGVQHVALQCAHALPFQGCIVAGTHALQAAGDLG